MDDDHPGRFQAGDTIYLVKDGQKRGPYQVEKFRQDHDRGLLKLKGVDSREMAEDLVFSHLVRDAEDLPDLEEGSYYIRDLVGLRVVDGDGRLLGQLEDVLPYPSQDVYVIAQAGDPEKKAMVPAVDEFIKEIDLEKGEVVIQPIGGMFDEN